ncbi:MAG TPA: response regulator transcription factor [Bacteroidales bacterium]|nr:response regulator transcription factor [Bacteroidales bacterium]HRX96615.1 response regulator transcription factor [Bacteroidales bacterium]
MIHILIVDDHQVVLDGLKSMLDKSGDITVAGQALSGPDALEFLKSNPVDVALIDINLPGMDGIELCKKIIADHPDIKVLALTTFNEVSFIKNMMKSGASGYLLKNTGADELITAIKTVSTGEQYLSPEVQQKLVSSSIGQDTPSFIPKLTRREKEVLKLITEELTTREIAEKLFISEATVETHRLHLLNKLAARNTAGLVKTAIQKGLI